MATIVVYDLVNPGQKYDAIDKAMKALGGDRGLNTTWFFPNSVTPERAFDALAPHLDANDRAIAFNTGGLGKWRGFHETWTQWLQANL